MVGALLPKVVSSANHVADVEVASLDLVADASLLYGSALKLLHESLLIGQLKKV